MEQQYTAKMRFVLIITTADGTKLFSTRSINIKSAKASREKAQKANPGASVEIFPYKLGQRAKTQSILKNKGVTNHFSF